MGAYLRTANAAELLEIRPPAPVAAFMFGGALDAAPAAARNPVTTRDVASGEVLCELTCVRSCPQPRSPLRFATYSRNPGFRPALFLFLFSLAAALS